MSYFKDNTFDIFLESIIFFFFKNFDLFSQYLKINNLRHQKYGSNQLKNTQVLKVRNST